MNNIPAHLGDPAKYRPVFANKKSATIVGAIIASLLLLFLCSSFSSDRSNSPEEVSEFLKLSNRESVILEEMSYSLAIIAEERLNLDARRAEREILIDAQNKLTHRAEQDFLLSTE